MSDVADWTSIGADYTRKLADQALPIGNTDITVDLVDTDRSIVVLTSNTVTTVNLTVTGGTSGVVYTPTDVVQNIAGQPYAVPVYGVIDSTATLAFTSSSAGGHVWILATPDQFLAGGGANPDNVTNVPQRAVQVISSLGGSEGLTGDVVVSNTPTTLITGAVGVLGVIDTISIDSPSAANIGVGFLINSSVAWFVPMGGSDFQWINPKWQLANGDTLSAVTTNIVGGTVHVKVCWHNVGLPN